MSTKYTPGPWYETGLSEDYRAVYSDSTDGDGNRTHSAVCKVDILAKTEEARRRGQANARLIAAAPELLEALEGLGCKPDGYCFCNGQGENGAHTGECNAARAAIAKATGGEAA